MLRMSPAKAACTSADGAAAPSQARIASAVRGSARAATGSDTAAAIIV